MQGPEAGRLPCEEQRPLLVAGAERAWGRASGRGLAGVTTWSFVAGVRGSHWRMSCQEASDVTEFFAEPALWLTGRADPGREAVAVIGRLGERGRKRANTSPSGRGALGRAAVPLAQREQSRLPRSGCNEDADATLGFGHLEALSDPDEWGLRTGGCRGPAGGAAGRRWFSPDGRCGRSCSGTCSHSGGGAGAPRSREVQG